MGRTSRFRALVLALLAGFALFCGGWYLSRASLPRPYRVTTAQQPAEERDGSFEESVAEEKRRPDSLLPGEVININTADSWDLRRLPGIGEKRAMDIAAWREEHGPFRNVEELTQVAGIGPAILENLREYVTTGNE